MRLFRWIRSHSERFLIEASQRRAAEGYFGTGALPPRPPGQLFWRRVFVPVYRRLPWALRLSIIRAMPGSHREHWRGFAAKRRAPGIRLN